MKHRFRLNQTTGAVEFLTAPPVPFTYSTTRKRRFSEIVPCNPVLLVLFRAIRLMSGESGRMAQWTRGWRCEWRAVILMGTNAGKTMRCRNRQALIDWEHELFAEPRFEL